MSFNRYERELDGAAGEWLRKLGKPAIIGEFHFGSTDRGMFAPGVVDVGSEVERESAYAAYIRSVAANPDFVGFLWSITRTSRWPVGSWMVRITTWDSCPSPMCRTESS